MDSRNEKIAKVVLDITGAWGRWQMRFFLSFVLLSMLTGWHILQLTFVAPNIEFWCADQVDDRTDFDTKGMSYANRTIDGINGTSVIDDQCGSCGSWRYDIGGNESIYTRTIVSEWNLVCDRKWLIALTHSLYMLGALLSNVCMSHASDRFGRKPTIIAGWTMALIGTTSAALSTSILQFLFSRFLLSFGLTAAYSIGFVLLLEIVGSRYRERIGYTLQFGWAAGYCSLPAIVWVVRDFRHLQAVCIVAQLCQGALMFISLIESPRWLLARDEYELAIGVLQKALKINGESKMMNCDMVRKQIYRLRDEEALSPIGQSTDLNLNQISSSKTNGINEDDDNDVRKKYSVLDLFRTTTMARITLIVYFVWFANSFVYYGLSLNSNQLAGDPFVNFFLMGVIEVPAYAITIYLVECYGNRRVLIGSLLGAGIGCWASIAIALHHTTGILLTMTGKAFVTISYAVVYVYTTQLFPTVTRTIGLGTSSVCARIASALAPYLKNLVEQTSYTFSMILIGSVAICAAIAVIPLRESKGTSLADKPEDLERRNLPPKQVLSK